jgi:hypothetical protein
MPGEISMMKDKAADRLSQHKASPYEDRQRRRARPVPGSRAAERNSSANVTTGAVLMA